MTPEEAEDLAAARRRARRTPSPSTAELVTTLALVLFVLALCLAGGADVATTSR